MNLKEFRRGRSVFERALDMAPYNISLYIRYAQCEIKHKNINYARNIFERAIRVFPKVE